MDSEQLQNAANVIAFRERKQNEQHAAYPNVWSDVVRYFHEDVDHRTSWDYKRIDGCRSMHFVAFVSHLNNTLLNVRDFACFCPEYMDENFEFCNTLSHVKPWKLLTLEPLNVTQVLQCLNLQIIH
jgi:hypothetical protein